jgi:hypothetical protein
VVYAPLTDEEILDYIRQKMFSTRLAHMPFKAMPASTSPRSKETTSTSWDCRCRWSTNFCAEPYRECTHRTGHS